MKVVWLPLALDDLDAQIDYIAAQNPKAAVAQFDRILHQADRLGDHPEMGRPGREPDTREWVVTATPFIVIYRLRPKAQSLEILRLLHGAQQWPV
ncbi:type II toxin-antitoxin system RelE/ParE family toxin [Microvirga pudoricolor]|uniref:type II toxin-antitoxin system RelE/ParE family toxin n=1 Tax=Microvirga pudoricolor TaxID=2778729 RepID=UPI001952398F|nr:type II toxin-antitoxin system RelE/ParE family toxin [Microvirga pudoricolor]MBM6593960.1 type II toxin-antitoxin system RelE/ParE family toxin [Microvirga pudoricolor]